MLLKHARLQFQLATLSRDLVHQLTLGRLMNTRGGTDHNNSCDLHDEHVNRLFKGQHKRAHEL